MKKTLLAMLGPVLALLGACHEASSQHFLTPGGNEIPPGSSVVVEETRPVSGVTEVVLSGAGFVFIHQGAMESLRVRTEERIMPYITTRQYGGRLTLGFVDGTSHSGEASAIEFHLTVHDLELVELSGVGRMTVTDIDSGRLSIVHNGVGSVNLSGLTATELDVSRTGLGEIDVAGAVQRQTVTLGGQGAYAARDLHSVEAGVTIRSSGSATVRVSDRLDARIDGSGSVYYLGNPVVHRTGSGSGSVTPI